MHPNKEGQKSVKEREVIDKKRVNCFLTPQKKNPTRLEKHQWWSERKTKRCQRHSIEATRKNRKQNTRYSRKGQTLLLPKREMGEPTLPLRQRDNASSNLILPSQAIEVGELFSFFFLSFLYFT